MALLTVAPARAQCGVTSGTGATPWPTCTTWSGPSWWSWLPSAGTSGQIPPQLITTDINGDGLADLYYLGGGYSPGFGVATSSGTSFTNVQQSLSVPYDDASSSCYTGNFDGSGRTGIACFTPNGTSWQLSVANVNSTGTSFTSFSTPIAAPIHNTSAHASAEMDPLSNPCLVMDVNGDGRDDIVCGESPPATPPWVFPGSSTWGVYLSTGASFTYQSWSGSINGYTVTTGCYTGDFNGDGLKDIACANTYSDWTIALSTGVGWSVQDWSNGPNSLQSSPVCSTTGCGGECVVGDFDGDGVDDIACAQQSPEVQIGFGGANGGFKGAAAASWSVPSFTTAGGYVTTDLYGVGRDGIVCATTLTTTSTGWTYWASTGTSFTPTSYSTSWSLLINNGQGSNILPGTISQLCKFADFNADGIEDVACDPTSISGVGVWYMGLSSVPQ